MFDILLSNNRQFSYLTVLTLILQIIISFFLHANHWLSLYVNPLAIIFRRSFYVFHWRYGTLVVDQRKMHWITQGFQLEFALIYRLFRDEKMRDYINIPTYLWCVSDFIWNEHTFRIPVWHFTQILCVKRHQGLCEIHIR
jgi:hypothetical protein